MEELQIFKDKIFGSIRVVFKDNKCFFCGSDVAKALGYARPNNAVARHCRGALKRGIPVSGKIQDVNFISEGDVYRLIVRSKLESAERFESWLFDEMVPALRKQAGLEAHEAFRMMDKAHQKHCMDIISTTQEPNEVSYIKANTIANKCVSNVCGYPKMISKREMSDEQLKLREMILEDTVNAMKVKDNLSLDFSVSNAIYNKYRNKEEVS